MTVTAVFNAILGVAVVVAVVAPLVWAILTQHRDRLATTGGADVPSPHRLDRRRAAMTPPDGVERRAGRDRRVPAPHPQYKPVMGRA
jgi:hypothetical protein